MKTPCMDDQLKQLQELLEKAGQLEKIQQNLSKEIEGLRAEIETIQSGVSNQVVPKAIETKPEPKKTPPIQKPSTTPLPVEPVVTVEIPKSAPEKKPQESTRWEEFIGTNLLNKIGIAILVIGIGFGVKYAIDHDMLDALTRIILGYLASAGLLTISLRIKKDYQNFSAVLLSGAMASLYFVTYAAYDFYSLIPQILAFVLMVLFTAFTVLASLRYDLTAIAIIGLVGAYAVPFLLSDGSGNVLILFSYMLIINSGILILSFFKNWKVLYYTAFLLTWIIFISWYAADYDPDKHFWLTLIFSALFFAVFYTAFLSYKLIRHEAFGRLDTVFLLANSFIEFGIGYSAFNGIQDGEQYLGLFTVFNAVLHFIVCYIIYRSQERYKNIFYFVAGLVLTFLTIAVPVQLEGNWVTLIWATEAVVLFWIGRTKKVPAYEIMSYPLIALAFVSLSQDWDSYYQFYLYNPELTSQFAPFLNIHFFTGLWVGGTLFLLHTINRNPDFEIPVKHKEAIQLINFGLPALLLVTVYSTFYIEIGYYWENRFAQTAVTITLEDSSYQEYNHDLLRFKTLWLIHYSALFGIALSLLSLRLKTTKNPTLLLIGYNYLVLGAFLILGLYEISMLRNSYMNQPDPVYFLRDYWFVTIRYVSFVFVIPLLWLNDRLLRSDSFNDELRKVARLLFHIIVLAMLSSELIHWLDLGNVPNTFKLGLTILWGTYALFMIILGLRKDQKFMRVAGIVIFGITVVKLFLYDMAGMSTISRTIVMISLGVLMLISSFLYNRSKKMKGV
jgi:uncharacterized membrane protein